MLLNCAVYKFALSRKEIKDVQKQIKGEQGETSEHTLPITNLVYASYNTCTHVNRVAISLYVFRTPQHRAKVTLRWIERRGDGTRRFHPASLVDSSEEQLRED